MKVAFTSSDGETVDRHFGQAESLALWDIGPSSATFLGRLEAVRAPAEEDRIAAQADALAGCAIVVTLQIGGPAAAKLVARRIHPMRTAEPARVEAVIAKFQSVLQGSPPPWLRKLQAPQDERRAS